VVDKRLFRWRTEAPDGDETALGQSILRRVPKKPAWRVTTGPGPLRPTGCSELG